MDIRENKGMYNGLAYLSLSVAILENSLTWLREKGKRRNIDVNIASVR